MSARDSMMRPVYYVKSSVGGRGQGGAREPRFDPSGPLNPTPWMASPLMRTRTAGGVAGLFAPLAHFSEPAVQYPPEALREHRKAEN